MSSFLVRQYRIIFTALLVVLLVLSFAMGFLTGRQRSAAAVTLSCSPDVLEQLAIPVGRLSRASAAGERTPVFDRPASGAFVGSKNGTKYYTPGCSGAERIKPANYVWFATVQEAQLQGYTKGAC